MMKGGISVAPKNKDASPVLINIILVALWALIVDFWVTRHFGSTNVLVLFSLPLSISVFQRVVEFFIEPQKKESFQKEFRSMLKRILDWRVIGILYLLSFAFAMNFTSLHITPFVDSNSNQISLSELDTNKTIETVQTKADKPVRFLLRINPFATHYKLSVTGYLDKVVNLPPFIGTTIVPSQDLVPLPTLLYRPTGQSNKLLTNNGWFELYSKHSDGTFHLLSEQQGKLAWFSGPRRQQLNSLHNEWRLELSANTVKPRAAAILMLRWRNPKSLVLTNEIEPEQLVCALITNIDRKKYFAGMIAKVTTTPYQDLPLADFDLKELNNEMGNDNHSANDVCNWLVKGTS